MLLSLVRFISILLSLVLLCSNYGVNSSHDWDILIFTQHWPITVCMHWTEEDPHHSCKLLPENSWTIHGVWPTKLGTEGPSFCNHTLHFHYQQLKPIENDLLTYWPDIYNGSETGLWKHEWTKHGTCAVVLEELNSELKYFSKGIEWLQKYAMQNILSRAGINPDNKGYTPLQVWNAVRGSLNKNPAVQCMKDKKSGQWLLFEIRMCFDKSLQLVDCDTSISNLEENNNKILSNCPLSQTLIYPSHMPREEEILVESKPYRAKWLLHLLQIIQLIQWITL